MSGHNKWSQIKFQKATKDLRRGKEFSKILNAISAAAKQGGGDWQTNIRLRLLIDNARKINLPKENIEKAILRGTGQLPGVQIEEILYEIYGPAGVAILIEATTDNKNRTTAEIRSVLNRFGGKLGQSGSVGYLFEQQGQIVVNLSPLPDKSEEEIELKAIDAGALDIEKQDANIFIYTQAAQLEPVKHNLEEQGIPIAQAKLSYEPQTMIPVRLEDKAKQIFRLMDALEEIEDVTAIYSNFDIPAKLV